MKVILIKEEEVKHLIDMLELKKLKLGGQQYPVDEIHRQFHYLVVNWFHDQGSSYPHL